MTEPPAGPALSVPATRRVMRRRLLTPVVVTVVGLAMLVAFVVLVTAAADHSDWLRSNGESTVGTVLGVTQNSGGGRQATYTNGSVRVSYRAGARELTATVSLGESARRYRVGQQVTVFYDPANPRDLTIDDAVNQGGWRLLVAILLVTIGVLTVGVGVVVWIRHGLYRRLLARESWRADDENARWVAGPRHRRVVYSTPGGAGLRWTKLPRNGGDAQR